MYNSKYYTCEQIDQRLLEGYYDDAVAAGYNGSKAQYLAGLLKAINYSDNPTMTADKVVYNPAISGLTPKNIQDAIDELANKKANSEDVDSKIQTEQERVNAELDKKFDKENIAQEFGDSDDKVVSQFALPFRYIQSEEFIFAKVDGNDKLLFGIQWDGTPVFGKTSAVEDRLQSQVNLLADKVTAILGDDDTTSAIDTLKDLKDFFANIDNTNTLTSILANLNSVSTKLGEDIKNIQDAIDELANKKANSEDVDSKIQTEQERVNAELDKKFDKENIAQEFGDSDDKVVSQFALPFRYIQSEEFIFAKVDGNDKLLFGIQWDGTPVFGKTSAVEDRLQSQVNLLADKVTAILGDDDTTSAIDTLKDLKDFFANIDNTNTLTSILANLNSVSTKLGEDIKNLQDTKVDKEEGKSLIEDEVKECFRIIENEEFLKAIVDADDKVLFGFYRATGKPYYPLNEMYHVIQNEEYFAAWLDSADHVLLGIRRDGQIIGEIHAVNALKQVISQLQSDLTSLQEKVGTIDTNLEELLDVFSLQDNEEYLAVEQDAEGKILSATNPDGSHYIHNAKSETIPTEFEHIEDPEGRTEITTDAKGKILGYRDSEGTRHEHKISANHLELSDEAANEVNDAFKSAGIKMENPSDFSKDSHIELPIPRIAAQVRIYAHKLPITKHDDIEAEIEYNDKDGNYFKKPVILNAQGSSSMSYYVKNMAIDINDGSEIKFGDFPTQDSFHLKKYYIDAFRGQCIVGYWLMEQIYKSRPLGQQYPYEYSYSNNSDTEGYGDVKKDFFNGAKCHPDGFPIIITWVNSKTEEETYMGIYTWNLKKSKEVYNCNKKTAENIILDGEIAADTLFGGTINWGAFEVRNPKSLIDINGNKYDGDNPKELSDTDKLSKTVKTYIQNLSGLGAAVKASDTKETYERYLLINPTIDYMLLTQVTFHHDGLRKNWIWLTLDGKKWCPNAYDMDSIFGNHWNGTTTIPNSDTINALDSGLYSFMKVYKEELSARYKELRDLKIFDANNIVGLLNKWLASVGYDNLKKEFEIYNETPSYRDSKLNSQWELADVNATQAAYSDVTEYNQGNLCSYLGMTFRAKETVTGIPPLSGTYDKAPKVFGFYNSPQRVYNWLVKRIAFLDNYYSYK